MISVAGVFKSRADAEKCVTQLGLAGIPQKDINILIPHVSKGENEHFEVRTSTGEQPGMLSAIGAVAGGAVGLAVGEMVASLIVPGVGPVMAVGLASGGLLGALAGGTVGSVGENAVFDGLPEMELFVYEDALRQGCTIMIAVAGDKTQAEAARGMMEYSGAESIDRAREMWWLGLRDVERERYQAERGDFEKDEPLFRCGFEAAQNPANREKTYESCKAELAKRYPTTSESEAFRRGYVRGRAYSAMTRKGLRSP